MRAPAGSQSFWRYNSPLTMSLMSDTFTYHVTGEAGIIVESKVNSPSPLPRTICRYVGTVHHRVIFSFSEPPCSH